MPKFWVKKEGDDDDEALGVHVDDDADVSDLLQASVSIIDFSCKPSELRLFLDGTALSNRESLGNRSGSDVFTLKPKHPLPAATNQQQSVAVPPLRTKAVSAAQQTNGGKQRQVSPRPRLPLGASSATSTRRSASADRNLPTGQAKSSLGASTARPSSAPRNSTPTNRSTSGTPREGSASASASGVRRPSPVRAWTPPSRIARSPSATRTNSVLRDQTNNTSLAPPAKVSTVGSRLYPGPTHQQHEVRKPCNQFGPKWGTPNVCGSCGLTRMQHDSTSTVPARRAAPARTKRVPQQASAMGGTNSQSVGAAGNVSQDQHVDPVPEI